MAEAQLLIGGDVSTEPFVVRYSHHPRVAGIDAREYAESLQGYSRIYTQVTYWLVTRELPPKRGLIPTYRYARPLVLAQKGGSLDAQWILQGTLLMLEPQTLQHMRLIINWVMDAVKNKKQALEPDSVIRDILRDRQHERETTEQTVLGLVDILAPGVTRAITPIGKTCSSITQFADTEAAKTITEADAEVMRSDEDLEVDEMKSYKLAQVQELDLATGHCRVLLSDDPTKVIPGRINDPVLQRRGDPYSQALANRTELTVKAKAVKRNGELKQLYISDVQTR